MTGSRFVFSLVSTDVHAVCSGNFKTGWHDGVFCSVKMPQRSTAHKRIPEEFDR